MRRQLALLVATAATLTILAVPAPAAIVEITPSTATSLDSLGTPIINTAGGGIRCFFDLQISMVSWTSGTLTASPNPLVNPWVGRSNGGTVESCGTTTTLLFSPSWRYYVYEVNGAGGANGYLENVEVLFDYSASFKCLYRLRLEVEQPAGLELLEVTGVTVLQEIPLVTGGCPPLLSFTGTFAFDVPHEFEL
jgi:hypothetical protein